MEKRLQAMIDAANTVKPALNDFYQVAERRTESTLQPHWRRACGQLIAFLKEKTHVHGTRKNWDGI